MQQPAPGGDQEDMQEGEAPDSGQAQAKGGVSELIINIDQGLTKLGALMQNAKVPPEAMQAISASLEAYRQAVGILTGGGAAPEAGPQKMPAGMGMADANQGGNKNAVPAM